MKTPREILFARHRQAEPGLDAIRRSVVAGLPSAGEKQPACSPREGSLLSKAGLRTAWLELIWPSRRAWAGMAVLWLAVMAANLEMQSGSTPPPAAGPAPARDLVQALAEQRRLLAELLPPVNPPPLQPQRSAGRLRSEWRVLFKAC